MRYGPTVGTKNVKIPDAAFAVKTKGSIYWFGEIDGKGERSVFRDEGFLPTGGCKITKLEVGKNMEFFYPESNCCCTTAMVSWISIQ